MYTKTDICNKALLKLAQRDTVADLDNPVSFVEKVFSREYDSVRQDCIKLMCPAFACKKSVSLTCDQDRKFWMPSEALRIISVNGGTKYTIGYANEIVPLYNNVWGETIKVDYVVDVEDTALFSTDFVNFLALALAASCGNAIVKDSNIMQFVTRDYEVKKASYGATNSQEKQFRKKNKKTIDYMMDFLN